MTEKNLAALLHHYSNALLEICDHQEEYTRSDLQGAIEAIVMMLLRNDHMPIIKQHQG